MRFFIRPFIIYARIQFLLQLNLGEEILFFFELNVEKFPRKKTSLRTLLRPTVFCIRIKVDVEYDKTMLLNFMHANDSNGNQLDSREKFHWIFGHRAQGYLFNV